MKHPWIVAIVLTASVTSLAALLWIVPALQSRPGDPSDAGQVASGQKIYANHCTNCHGDHLQGQPDWRIRKPDGKLPAPPHDVAGHTWHHPDSVLFELTKFGLTPPLAPPGYASDMPAFAGQLSDADIWAVLAYIKSTWPPDVRERQRQMSAGAAR
jgi:mono/diheme cytochrome c family protein